MSLRALFAWAGLIQVVAAGTWLWMFRTGGQRSWIARQQRLLVGYVVATGSWFAVGNFRRLDQPIVFIDIFDQMNAVIAIVGGAVAAVVTLGVYLQNRRWDQ